MCGIAGYRVFKGGDIERTLRLFEYMLLQSQIRGHHSTGVAWAEDDKIKVRRLNVSAKDFLKSESWRQAKDRNPKSLIAHCRYSTSGLTAQPVATHNIALVHNGLISMGTQAEFQRKYGTATDTDNDSEVWLQKIDKGLQDNKPIAEVIEHALESMYKVDAPIYSGAIMDTRGKISLVKDDVRPLWFWYSKELETLGFASTEDIINRAMLAAGINDYAIWPAKSYHVYTLDNDIATPTAILEDLPPAVESAAIRQVHDTRVLARFSKLPLNTTVLTPTRVDHRKNPRKAFLLYSAVISATWEVDPNYPLMKYLFDRYELSQSQQYWACWLYGVFYHPGTVFYVMQEFPEFEKVDLGRLKKWHAANWKNLRYNTDRKYEKGHFVEMFESYVKVIGSQTPTAQALFFDQYLQDTPVENFHSLWKSLNKLLRFGRYSLFIYTECLARCMGLPIVPDTMFLKESDSSRAGLAYAIGRPELAKGTLSKEQWEELHVELASLMDDFTEEFPKIQMDYWLIESCLCAFKGYFRDTKGRYISYYLDRMAGEILEMQNKSITQGCDWGVLWQFRNETFPKVYLGEYRRPYNIGVKREWEHILRDTGEMIGLEAAQQAGIVGDTYYEEG